MQLGFVMERGMPLAFGRLLAVILLSLLATACQTSGEATQTSRSAPEAGNAATLAYSHPAGSGPAQVLAEADQPTTVAAAPGRSKVEQAAGSKGYFIEFRSRYALSYGHSFVIFGRMNQKGQMINPEVAGLAPKSNDPAVYALGHAVWVPASTGWTDGDLEDEYMSANWRVMLTEAEYRKVVAYIRELQKKSRVWHAALYNCNAFVGEIARFMGYRTPFIWLRSQQYITALREMNGGPNAIGETRAPG